MKKLLLLLLVGLFLFSCKKKQTIHITAKNAATGEPYPGLTYYLVTYTNINGGTKSKTVATGTLDANGEAIVTERLSKNKGHGVRVVEPENSCYNKNIQLYFSEEDGENFKAEFEFAECAYQTLKVNNVNCQGPNDLFDMDMKLLYDMEYSVFGFSEKTGCYSNEFSNETKPAGKYFVEWWVTRNGNTDYFTDTIELIENELFVYEINY